MTKNTRSILVAFLTISTILILDISCATQKGLAKKYVEKVENINFEMIMVKGGEFMMGCDKKKRDCNNDELPVHKIILDDFYISKYEITFSQYDLFCKKTGKEKVKDFGWGRKNRPVVYVNWFDAQEFCKWLSEVSGKEYRLPTEAEWEYAAKGGRKSKGFIYAGSNKAKDVAFYLPDNHPRNDSISYLKTQIVGQKKPNELGLYDMSGNVWEWCADGYKKDYYKKSPLVNPKSDGFAKSARGGGWQNKKSYCLVSNRDSDHPKVRDSDLGFRIVRVINNTPLN